MDIFTFTGCEIFNIAVPSPDLPEILMSLICFLRTRECTYVNMPLDSDLQDINNKQRKLFPKFLSSDLLIANTLMTDYVWKCGITLCLSCHLIFFAACDFFTLRTTVKYPKISQISVTTQTQNTSLVSLHYFKKRSQEYDPG